jgi:hypothetical protein
MDEIQAYQNVIVLRLAKLLHIKETTNFGYMEAPTDQLPPDEESPKPEQRRIDAANDFLEICDRLSTEYESGFYWEDVQRALRIAAGLEKWPG